MAIRRSENERRRRAFLHALASGSSVGEAAEHAGIAWSTLYAWRRKSTAFAAAWDEAVEFAYEALTDRLQSALIQRAVEGVDEPVFHAGKLVGTRKRHSDTLLIAGLRHLTGAYYPTPPTHLTLPEPGEPVRPRMIMEPLKDNDASRTTPAIAALATIPADELTAPEPATPEPITSEILTPPPEPAEAPAVDWSHLGRD